MLSGLRIPPSQFDGATVRERAYQVDPGDIVNSAIERKRMLLGGHRLEIAVADNLPLIQADPMLIERSLGQLVAQHAGNVVTHQHLLREVERSSGHGVATM